MPDFEKRWSRHAWPVAIPGAWMRRVPPVGKFGFLGIGASSSLGRRLAGQRLILLEHRVHGGWGSASAGLKPFQADRMENRMTRGRFP